LNNDSVNYYGYCLNAVNIFALVQQHRWINSGQNL